LALHRALISEQGGQCQTDRLACLVTMFTEGGQRSRSHGLAREVLAAQAAAIGVPLLTASATWDEYEAAFIDLLKQARDLGAATAVFGDIDIPPHRAWEEKVCELAGLAACLPLWQEDRHAILQQWWQIGGECRLVVARENLVDRRHLGRVLDRALAAELAATGIDPCGENGEFHTCVTACPLFRQPLKVALGDQLQFTDCWFQDLQLLI
jgi:uncharacterized protein (TIGR00290 family)